MWGLRKIVSDRRALAYYPCWSHLVLSFPTVDMMKFCSVESSSRRFDLSCSAYISSARAMLLLLTDCGL